MDILKLPFNALIGIRLADATEYMLMLEAEKKYTNHVGTVHAAALYALAEATGAQFLILNFQAQLPNYFPLLRKSEIKYKSPALGKIYSQARLLNADIEGIVALLNSKNRALLQMQVDLLNDQNVVVFAGVFEWFISEIK